MSRRKLFIILILAILTILYPPLVWAEGGDLYKGFTCIQKIESPTGTYFSFSIGPGFLYFRNIQGNLSPTPTGSFSNFSGADFKKIRGFSYNKTPLYEARISQRIFSWLNCGLSFYGQSEVSIESNGNSAITDAGNTAWAQFRSNLQLYAILAKFFFVNPYPYVVGRCALNAYFGLGVGPSWQSWTNNTVYELLETGNTFSSTTMSLRNKFCANATWTADAGLSLKAATNEPTLMVSLGCKYTDWGQMRSIGNMRNQNPKVAPFKAIKAIKVYSFCPYIGVTWCF